MPIEGLVAMFKLPALASVAPSWVEMLLKDIMLARPLLKPGAFLLRLLADRSAYACL